MQKYKSMLASKTFYATLIAALVAIYNILAPGQKWPAIPNEVFAILGAFGLWGVRTADSTILTPGKTAQPDNVVPSAPPTPAEVINAAVLPSGSKTSTDEALK